VFLARESFRRWWRQRRRGRYERSAAKTCLRNLRALLVLRSEAWAEL
jgi:hypothetical protein